MNWINVIWTRLTKKEDAKNIKQPCNCTSILDCPHSIPDTCNLNKDNCILAFELKNRRQKRNANQTLWIIGLIALVVYILVLILPEILFPTTNLSSLVEILKGVCLSIFAGSVLAICIDIPTRLQEYEKSFISALSSNSYIKSLDDFQLSKLRKNVTEQLHKTKVPNMAKDLIDFDQRILDLLRKPYYTHYRHSVICSLSKDKSSFIKEHTIEYELINPYGKAHKTVENIRLRNLVLIEDKEDPVSNVGLICQIDDDDVKRDFSDRIGFDIRPGSNEFYSVQVSIYDKNGDKSVEGIRVEFSDRLRVKLTYTIRVNKSDPCFTKRLKYPTKNFRLDYNCDDPSITLFGQILGTQINQSDISINYNDKKSFVSLETFDWLLPSNGAIVVMLKK